MSWVFCFDDMFDDDGLAEAPEAARQELDVYLALVAGETVDTDPHQHPLRHMFTSIWQRILETASIDLQKRFIGALRHYFEGIILQVDNRFRSSQCPRLDQTLDMYLKGRAHSIGLYPCQVVLQ
ncbi:putative terpene synthase metal binding domain protein [Eutypa lata UCREL1]|uniref:Putative terpene synthase metal binding domain protein n=1 Tax=Eutypa lata (strain UCR-EL1) TaxID=1287681 RepID=M7TEM2_EUTLA|nr:putative terpene synthase metal binding domain protein [Eutypa lata UCREL1]